MAKNNPNNILHIYTRVSTVAQADKGTSLESQQALGIKKAKELKFGHEVWNEGGKSSHHEDINGRPVLLKLYEAIKGGEVKHLWVYDQSRLSRNDQVASIFRYECNKQNVTLYTKDGQFDLSNPQDKFLKLILDGIGEFENSIRAERTRLGKVNRARQGFWFGGPPPFGYKIVDKKLELNKIEADWVKKIFASALKGESTLAIKKLLDSNGVLPRRKKGTWSLGSIQSLIKNTHYKGEYHYHDKKSDEKIILSCPAIVDETTWMAVQKLKQRVTSRVSQQNRTKQFYLLRDLMVCGHCGRPMSARRKESKNEQLYYCPNKERSWVENGGTTTPWKRGEGCGMKRSLNIPETDQLVWDAVIEAHKNSSLLKEEVKWKILEENSAPLSKNKTDIKLIERNLKQLQKNLHSVKEAQANLLLGKSSGTIKADVYQMALDRSNDEIHNLEVKIANTQLQLKGENESKKWVSWFRIFGDNIDGKKTLSDEEKKQYLAGLLDSIKVMYDEKKNEHELMLNFQLPIIGDGLIWNNPENRREGYKLKRGKKITKLVVKKKAPRWLKPTPERNDSVTVE